MGTVPEAARPSLERNTVIALAHSLRRSSVLSIEGSPPSLPITVSGAGRRTGEEEVGEERNFLPHPFMPVEATCCACQRIQSEGWDGEKKEPIFKEEELFLFSDGEHFEIGESQTGNIRVPCYNVTPHDFWPFPTLPTSANVPPL